jgi:fucose 4-O-acetylase-like acetyltransferase
LDAAKGVLITLVVFGHFLEAVDSEWEKDSLRLFLTVIYAFHMPAFVFLAGITASSRRLLQRVLYLAVLLAIFHCIYFVARSLTGTHFDWSWTTPHWILWFLVGMIGWTLTVPLIERFPRTLMAVSLVVGIGSGVLPFAGYEFALSRMLVFWPFFVIGKVAGGPALRFAASLPRWASAALCVFALAPAVALFAADVNKGWLYGSRNFDYLEASAMEGILTRLCLVAIALLLIAALLSCLPDRTSLVTDMGERSLSIYLLHGVVVIVCAKAMDGVFDSTDLETHLAAVTLCAAAAVGTAVVLSLPLLHRAVSVPAQRISAALASAVAGTSARSVPTSASPQAVPGSTA